MNCFLVLLNRGNAEEASVWDDPQTRSSVQRFQAIIRRLKCSCWRHMQTLQNQPRCDYRTGSWTSCACDCLASYRYCKPAFTNVLTTTIHNCQGISFTPPSGQWSGWGAVLRLLLSPRSCRLTRYLEPHILHESVHRPWAVMFSCWRLVDVLLS
jgi:hypothetical protein